MDSRREEVARLKIRHGCRVCAFRVMGLRRFGEFKLCRRGHLPKPGRQYCEQWKLDQKTIG